ncbi:hypothetical protein CROQUDRAFT_465381 [Cronartium quercuum f. sp. fusiforme G11]|uniref:Uncharacterized protein n=1 Tax=Cronartium quercuum f. sp. fusiforme G11 TaxID=708437 RepID=A0A9P6TIG6_9BASI|nr:hypothetical protein CROQUDRAFT_465381 [Cronartium quercuum f. sp. fusiforme G11]
MKNLVVYLGLCFAILTYSTALFLLAPADRELEASRIAGHISEAPEDTTGALPSALKVDYTPTQENNGDRLSAVGEVELTYR